MFFTRYTECHQAEGHYDEFCYAECRLTYVENPSITYTPEAIL